MFEIVEDQEHGQAENVLEILAKYFSGRLAASDAQAESLNNGGDDEGWIVNRGERHEVNSAGKKFGEAAGDFDGKPSFTYSAGAGDGDEAHVRAEQEFAGGRYFFFTPDEAGALNGNAIGANFNLGAGPFGEAVTNGGEFAGEIARGDVAFFGVFGEAAFDGPAERRGSLDGLQADGVDGIAKDGDEGFGGVGSLEEALAGEHFEQDGAEGKLIGAKILSEAAGLLGRHVLWRAHDQTGLGIGTGFSDGVGKVGGAGRRSDFGQAEVENFYEAILSDHQVGGLDVAMSDRSFVSFGESFGDLGGDFDCSAHGEDPGVEQVAESLARDHLHGNKMNRIVLAEFVDSDDVGMI